LVTAIIEDALLVFLLSGVEKLLAYWLEEEEEEESFR